MAAGLADGGEEVWLHELDAAHAHHLLQAGHDPLVHVVQLDQAEHDGEQLRFLHLEKIGLVKNQLY